MKKDSLLIIGNALAFQLLWFAAVLGGSGWAWSVLAPMVLIQCLAGGHWRRDGRMLLIGGGLCLALEPLWLASSLLVYQQWHSQWLAPPWIWALWLGFAVSFHYSLYWLQGRPWLAALIGAIGGVVSVTAGLRLGAAVTPQGWLPFAMVYGGAWALAVPFMAWVAGRQDHREEHYA
ncbi:hypothetical protein A11A3_01727 [Alcanivorax hongdengensis A-11-3]|uniref:DUF2878 domain-containing protein n=1 Tax=Alcanivorax hongdengensis A-11-3 TaxID=1177179 RepID=L0WHD8_9GAMM|nr:DUF2878 domain-containing protein [Alcanivorax hongdengensis]EKF75552.1 hypothetical protein A11A3_01727 [Alcanivorax hongdengensis A-11-3]